MIVRRYLKLNENAMTISSRGVVALYLFTVVCHGKLLKGPDNATVVEGQSVTFHCETDLEYTVFWYFNEKEIFYGGKISMEYASRFEVTTIPKGVYNLVIRNATKWYGGIYKCADDEGEGEKSLAWLNIKEHAVAEVAGESDSGKESETPVYIIVAISVVSVILAAAFIGALIAIMVCVKRRKHRKSSPVNKAEKSADAESPLIEIDQVNGSSSNNYSTKVHHNKEEAEKPLIPSQDDVPKKIDISENSRQQTIFPSYSWPSRSSPESDLEDNSSLDPVIDTSPIPDTDQNATRDVKDQEESNGPQDNSSLDPVIDTSSIPGTDQNATRDVKDQEESNGPQTPQNTKKNENVEEASSPGVQNVIAEREKNPNQGELRFDRRNTSKSEATKPPQPSSRLANERIVSEQNETKTEKN